MRNTITRYDQNIPLVLKETMSSSEAFNLWMRQVTDRGLLIGTGSPVGVIEAQQGVEYMDEAGAAGSVKWIK